MGSATIAYHKDEWQVNSGMTLRSAIEKLGLDPFSVLALRDKKLINDQTLIEDDDEITLVNVISGG